MSRLPVAIAALLGLALLVTRPGPAAAQAARSASWERFDVAIELLPDGTLWVLQTERIRFDGTFQRASREIPLERVASITEVHVGEGGQPYRAGYNEPGTFAATRSDKSLRIEWWFPSTTNASRTFELSYRVTGAVRVYSAGDQLYWPAAPADRPGPVEASEVVVRLPEAVPSDQLKAEAYLGGRPAGSQPSVAGRDIRFSSQDLPPGQEYQVRVQFPHGLVAAPTPPWQAAFDRQAWYDSAMRPILNPLLLVVALLILVGGLLACFLRWYTAVRDPAAGREPARVDAPPDNLPPGLVGTVVDGRADLQDVLATLIDLTNRGVIRITQGRDPQLQGSDLDYNLELLQANPLGLRSYEKTVIGAFFGPDRAARLSQVKERWVASSRLFESQLCTEALQQSLFADQPELLQDPRRRGALVTIVGAAVVGFVAQSTLGSAANSVWLPFLSLAVVGVAALVMAGRMPRRTRAGAIAAGRWRAFARHLASADQRRVAVRPEEMSRNLAYAVALGVDRPWLENFAAVGRPGPCWPAGNGPTVGLSGRPTPGDRGVSDLLDAASKALSTGGGSGWSGGSRRSD